MPASETSLSRRVLVAGGVGGGILSALPAQSQTGSKAMQTTVRVDNAVTTLVNVFTVEPDKQPKLRDMLWKATETRFSEMPGWIATNLLKSENGQHMTIYSQWRDGKDIDAFRQDPEVRPYLQRIGELAKMEAFTCDVSYTLHV